jgi:hypothetical protein
VSASLIEQYNAEQAARLDGTREKPCETQDPDIMFPDSEEQYNARGKRNADLDAARATCAGCWFKAECLELAISRRDRWGVWGGLTFTEREAVRRKRYARSARKPGTQVQDESLFDVGMIA